MQKTQKLGNATSTTADSFSEANAIRAGINYNQRGFLANAGLPNQGGTQYGIGEGFCKIAFLDQAREQLVKAGGDQWATRPDNDVREEYQRLTGRTVIDASAAARCPDVIYTHYPQGPDAIVGAFLAVFPLDQLWRLRLLPLFLTFAAQLWLLWELRYRMGIVLAGVAIAVIATAGAIRLFSHGLHQQGYVAVLLLMQLAFVLRSLRLANASQPAIAITMVVFGFLQGWLSFDFFFLVVLGAVPFLMHTRSLNRRTAAVFVLSPLVGFGAAQAVHFLQVAIHYGSLGQAATDLLGSALGRSAGPYDDFTGAIPSAGALVLDYLMRFVLQPNVFFGWAMPLAIVALLLTLVWHDLRSTGLRAEALHAFITLIVAALISSLWVLIMRQHAVVHTHFVPRHYLLLLIVALYLIPPLVLPAVQPRRPIQQAAGSMAADEVRAAV
jgi:hypothetical protein